MSYNWRKNPSLSVSSFTEACKNTKLQNSNNNEKCLYITKDGFREIENDEIDGRVNLVAKFTQKLFEEFCEKNKNSKTLKRCLSKQKLPDNLVVSESIRSKVFISKSSRVNKSLHDKKKIFREAIKQDVNYKPKIDRKKITRLLNNHDYVIHKKSGDKQLLNSIYVSIKDSDKNVKRLDIRFTSNGFHVSNNPHVIWKSIPKIVYHYKLKDIKNNKLKMVEKLRSIKKSILNIYECTETLLSDAYKIKNTKEISDEVFCQIDSIREKRLVLMKRLNIQDKQILELEVFESDQKKHIKGFTSPLRDVCFQILNNLNKHFDLLENLIEKIDFMFKEIYKIYSGNPLKQVVIESHNVLDKQKQIIDKINKLIDGQNSLSISCIQTHLVQIKKIKKLSEKVNKRFAKLLFQYPNLLFEENVIKETEITKLLHKEKKRSKSLLRIMSSKHYHEDCSVLRAARLIEGKPVGTYLLGPSTNHSRNRITLTYLKENEVVNIDLKPTINGTVIPDGKKDPVSIEKLVKKLTNTTPRPLGDIPMSHLQAQLEWNVISDPPEKVLSRSPEGAVCITKGAKEGDYILHILKLKSHTNDTFIKKVLVNTYNDRIEMVKDGKKIEAKSLYDLLTNKLGLQTHHVLHNRRPVLIFEELYYQKLLFEMHENSVKWTKISRKKYTFLAKSIFVSRNGDVFQQFHSSAKQMPNGNMVKNELSKGLLNKGTYKKVWRLKSFYSETSSTKFVRASLNPDVDWEQHMNKIWKLKKKLGGSPYFLLPTFVKYTNSKGRTKYAQIMPEMEGDLFEKSFMFSDKGKIRAMIQVAKGLKLMHEMGYCHLDIKLENVLVKTLNNRDFPEVLVSDFDFSKSVKHIKVSRDTGTPAYCDPNIYNGMCLGEEKAKAADQYAFGVMLYNLMTTGSFLRSGEEKMQTKHITKTFLEKRAMFQHFDPMIQMVIEFCIVGSNRQADFNYVIKSLKECIKKI